MSPGTGNAGGNALADAARRVRVVAVVGSPRPEGNTATVVRAALDELAAAGADCELIFPADHDIRFCQGHDECGEWEECPLPDEAAGLIAKLWAAEGVIIASPVYGDNVSAQLKVLLDRCSHNYHRGVRMRARVVGLVAVSWGTGLEETLDAMQRSIVKRLAAPAPILRLSGEATRLGDAARSGPLLAEARALGRRMAEVLGLTPAG